MMHATDDATDEETREIVLMTMEAPNVFYFSLIMVIVICSVMYIRKSHMGISANNQ
jgi:hypothetical protein